MASAGVACGDHGQSGQPCDLAVADLALSELMVDPAGEERAGEWLEVYNATDESVILNRLVVTVASAREQRHELRDAGSLGPREYFVMGGAAAAPAAPDYAYGGALELPNGGATVSLSCKGVLVDVVSYGAAGGPPLPCEGQSLSLDGALAPSAAANDAAESYCAGAAPFGAADTNRGTPGGPNPTCGRLTCYDGGRERPVVAPAAGDLVVNEVFADATGADAGREWIELFVAAGAPIDVNGVSIVAESLDTSSRTRAAVETQRCLAFAPGDFIVIGATADTSVNGIVAIDVVVPGLTVLNDRVSLSVRRGDVVVDAAVLPGAREGRAASLAPWRMAAGGNDDPAAFCVSEAELFFAERGTPGAPNLCGPLCRDGGVQRARREARPGGLVLTEVFPDPSGADDAQDWIELYVVEPVDLNGLRITAQAPGSPARSWRIAPGGTDACIPLEAGTFVVVGGVNASRLGVAVVATIGGAADALLPATGVDAGDVALQLTLPSGVVDESRYPQGNPAGKSFALDPGAVSAAHNDAVGNWCVATAPTNSFTGEAGSPGAENPDTCAPSGP